MITRRSIIGSLPVALFAPAVVMDLPKPGWPKIKPFTEFDLDVMARTLWGETRVGEDAFAVAWVISNRSVIRRLRPAHICLQPAQFSCWNKGDPNRPKMLALNTSAKPLPRAKILSEIALKRQTNDPTKGADLFHAASMKPFPWWAPKVKRTVQIGHHIFYKSRQAERFL